MGQSPIGDCLLCGLPIDNDRLKQGFIANEKNAFLRFFCLPCPTAKDGLKP